jgi:hypothetical protein
VTSKLASEVEVGVVVAAPAALVLMSSQLLGLSGFASGTSAQWSSGVVAATTAELPPLGCLLLLLSTPSTSVPILRHLQKAHTHQI